MTASCVKTAGLCTTPLRPQPAVRQFSYGTVEVEPVDYSDKVLRAKVRELESSTSGYASIWSVVRGPPRDYKSEAVFCTLFCFFPTGLIAMYFSKQVRYHYTNHNVAASYRASRITKFLVILTSFLGLITWFTGLFLIIHSRENRH